MRLLVKFWKNFKTQPDIWFFYGFLLTFTFSIRKVIYFIPIDGTFNEYASVCLYLSDIFLFLTILTWAISILESKSLFLSRRILFIPLFLIIWSFISISWSENHWLALTRSIRVLEFFLLFIYIIQKVPRLPTGENVPRLPAGKMFHACPPQKCSTWNISGRVEHFWEGEIILRNSFLIISILGLFQSIIGIIQVFLQHSIGLFWLKESLISPEIPGVAKIILDGERYIRAYGLFPHPNILGGFLVFSILITIYLLKIPRLPAGKMFHACPPENCSTWNNSRRVEHFWESGTFIKKFLSNSLGIQIIGLILTFSKSAILGLLIALGYLMYKKLFHPVKFLRNHGASAVHFKRNVLLVLILLALTVVIAKPDFYSFFQKSLGERTLGYKVVFNTSNMFHTCPVGQKCSTLAPLDENVPRLPAEELFHVEQFWEGGTFSDFSGWNISGHFRGGTFITNPVAGLGQGQFVLEMQEYIPQKLETWQFQPVHNVFLLILSELGLVGLGLFVWLLWRLLRISVGNADLRSLQKEVGKSILLAFIFIMLFDHYLWDIQQGQILLWLTFGLIAGDNATIFDKE